MQNCRALIAASLLIISGCSNQTARELSQIATPEHWSKQSNKSKETQEQTKTIQSTNPAWWLILHDETLNALIDEAISHSPDVLSAYSVIKEARIYRQQAESDFLPSLSLGLGAGRSLSESQAATSFSGSLNASWEADVFGAIGYAVTAKEAAEKIALENYADVLITLSAEVASTYINLIGYQIRLQITEESLLSWRESLDFTMMQGEAGLVSLLDVEQAKRSYEQSLAAVPTLKQSIVESQHQLAVLIGRQPTNVSGFSQKKLNLPTTPASVFLPIPAAVLRQRPDVKTAEQQVLIAMANTDKAHANRFPKFSLSGSLSASGISVSDLFSASALVKSLGVGISQSLFDGGKLKLAEAAQQEQEQQAIYHYKNVVLNALKETENTLSALSYTRERLLLLNSTLESSKKEEALALLQYETGQSSFSDVLVAQRTRLSLRQQNIIAQVNELSSVITLAKTTAGDWARAELNNSLAHNVAIDAMTNSIQKAEQSAVHPLLQNKAISHE